jgi:hypothetical protein
VLSLVDAPGVWLITGIQASGKSTLADGLARALPRAAHVRGGQFYRWAVTGWVQPTGPEPSPEVRRLLDLRYRLSAMVADEYARAGFDAVVQDNIYGADVGSWLDRVESRPRRLVVLRPRLEVVEGRERARRESTGKVAYRPGEVSPSDLDRALAETPTRGLWLDNSTQDPADTVREVLDRAAEAVVD